MILKTNSWIHLTNRPSQPQLAPSHVANLRYSRGRSYPFNLPQCHYDRVVHSPISRSLTIALTLAFLVAGCSDDSGHSSATSLSAPTETKRAGATSEFGIWPNDPTLLNGDAPALWTIEVVDVLPHDADSYTQGLELAGDVLVESRGRYGNSEIRLVDPTTGDIRVSAALGDKEFGEGATVVGSTIIQLTWQEEIAYVWSLDDLTLLDQFSYIGEGWGLCAQSDRLVMSNGSSTLTFRDPTDFHPIDTIDVTLNGAPVPLLNELECVDGFVFANLFRSDLIVVINPDTGKVVASVDASPLNAVIHRPSDNGAVLNGVARWTDDSLILGGKWWPEMAVVRLITG